MYAYCRSERYRKHPKLPMVPPSILTDSPDSFKNVNHMGQFRIRRMLQARLFRKSNPDAHYANAVYKFMRERAVKNRQNIAFSADAKCKVPTGEPGYPIVAVTGGKKVIVGLNEKFLLTNHDFSKLSIIPDTYLLHEIPEKDELMDEKVNDGLLNKDPCLGEWYSGQVFQGVKSMVSEGSSAMQCAAEIADVNDNILIKPNAVCMCTLMMVLRGKPIQKSKIVYRLISSAQF